MPTGTYLIKNSTGTYLFVEKENANGSSTRIQYNAIVALSEAGYQQAVNAVGINNVVSISVGTSSAIVITGSLQYLPNIDLTNGVLVTSRRSNVGNIYVDHTNIASTNSYCLEPGNSVSLSITKLSQVSILGENVGDILNYIGN